MLKQKTQLHWFQEGDANTKYFHALVRGRRRRLFIHQIHNENEECIQGEDNIAHAARAHFQGFFIGQEERVNEDILQLIPRSVTQEQNQSLQAMPTIEELKTVVFSMNPNSAAGPDGMGESFFMSAGISLRKEGNIHWASWESLSFPIDEGGIGFRNLNDVCKALQFKQWWNFRTKNSLWGQYLRAKYCQRANPIAKKFDSGQSLIWKYMMQNKHTMESHISWKLNSVSCQFWWDNWLAIGPLSHHINISVRFNNSSVSQFLIQGSWIEGMLRQHVPPHLVRKILNL
ncbi:hypothetical protein H5410_001742 [Solanum commersonii]|uniref:Uncharacterized protein n=1 Tax=Solanum commersonii TaxID=4109 RepID=A0A9J6B007_SOLCO|nr:hypothetical protein H5410_001742 [Solanum commersonii]